MGDNLTKFKEIGFVGSQYRLNALLLLTKLKTQNSARAKRPASANSTHHF
ncbi:hypothetical protein ACQFX9_00815 [Aliinostoc sp. HNIBRCY26]